MTAIVSFIKAIPSMFKAGSTMFTKFKELSVKGRIAVLTITPVALLLIAFAVDQFGIEAVKLAASVLVELMQEI